MLVQRHTDSGRLVVNYVPGAVNPTDCLTKHSDRKHAQMLSELSGLQLPTAMRSLFASTAAVLESFQPMSAQNRPPCDGRLAQSIVRHEFVYWCFSLVRPFVVLELGAWRGKRPGHSSSPSPFCAGSVA